MIPAIRPQASKNTSSVVRKNVAILIPYFIPPSGISFTALAAMFCTKVHIYQLLPSCLQNPGTFVVLLMHEVVLQQQVVGIFAVICEQLLVFFENTCAALGSEITQLRKIVLRVRLFNYGHSWTTYLVKIVCLAFATICGYSGITSFSKQKEVAAFSVVLAMYLIIFYDTSLGNAFSIPDKLQTIKRES
ncbi:unnamed protein product, partial [Allacma fusca]